MTLSKKVQKLRRCVSEQVGPLVNGLKNRDFGAIAVEILHAINNVVYDSDQLDVHPKRWGGRPTGSLFKLFHNAETKILSSLWISKEDQEDMSFAGNYFHRKATVTRGSRMVGSSALPVDLTPVTTMEEAIKLVQSGEYKWVTKNGIMCLASIEERPNPRVIGSPISVTRL